MTPISLTIQLNLITLVCLPFLPSTYPVLPSTYPVYLLPTTSTYYLPCLPSTYPATSTTHPAQTPFQILEKLTEMRKLLPESNFFTHNEVRWSAAQCCSVLLCSVLLYVQKLIEGVEEEKKTLENALQSEKDRSAQLNDTSMSAGSKTKATGHRSQADIRRIKYVHYGLFV